MNFLEKSSQKTLFQKKRAKNRLFISEVLKFTKILVLSHRSKYFTLLYTSMPRSKETSLTKKPLSLPLPSPSPLSLPLSQPVVPKNSFATTVKEGFGLGLGASIARNIVDRILSPKIEQKDKTPYELCLEQTKHDKDACAVFKQS